MVGLTRALLGSGAGSPLSPPHKREGAHVPDCDGSTDEVLWTDFGNITINKP